MSEKSRYTFKLPDIGEGIAESEIAQWHVAVGEQVSEDQNLVDMLTDKAAVELPSPVTGVVIELCGQPGDMIAVGATLAVIETAETGVEALQQSVQTAETQVPSAPPPGGDRAPAHMALQLNPLQVLASPAVRRRAREQDVDLSRIDGSGSAGRVTQADLDAWLASCNTPAYTSEAAVDEVEEVRIIGLRRSIANAMQRSKQRIPHFAYVEEVDVTELEALRIHLNASRRETQPKLTLLPFLLRALVRSLPAYPSINANFDDEAGVLRRHRAVHCGIAAQTPGGLMVPVLRHAETLDLWQSASGIARLAESARAGRASREELSGSTITITSLGPLGGIASTPVINAPEVAIIGVNRMVERPTYIGGQLVPRLMMNLSSSFDHRIVDGHEAASFIQSIKRLLEHPARIFIPDA